MLYFSFLYLTHFITGSLYLCIPFPHFAHLSPPSSSPPLWQSSVISLYLWVCPCFSLFVYCVFEMSHVSEVIWYPSMWNHKGVVFIWLILNSSSACCVLYLAWVLICLFCSVLFCTVGSSSSVWWSWSWDLLDGLRLSLSLYSLPMDIICLGKLLVWIGWLSGKPLSEISLWCSDLPHSPGKGQPQDTWPYPPNLGSLAMTLTWRLIFCHCYSGQEQTEGHQWRMNHWPLLQQWPKGLHVDCPWNPSASGACHLWGWSRLGAPRTFPTIAFCVHFRLDFLSLHQPALRATFQDLSRFLVHGKRRICRTQWAP